MNIVKPTVIGEKIIEKGIGTNITYNASLGSNFLLSETSKINKITIDATTLLARPAVILLIK